MVVFGDIVVWILVGGVAFLVVRRFYRLLTGATGSCGCVSDTCQQVRSCNQREGSAVECGNVVTGVSGNVVHGTSEEPRTKGRAKGEDHESQTH